MSGFTRPLRHFPFFFGSISGTHRQMPLTISLGDHDYTVDLREYKNMSQETLKPSFATSDETNDSLFSASGSWSRYRYSWIRGADQEFADLRADADPHRFLDSNNVDVWTDHELRLLKRPALVQAEAAVVQMETANNIAYTGAGTELYAFPIAGVWSHLTDPGGSIQAMSTNGTDLYVGTTTGLVKYTGSTGPTAFTTPVTVNVNNVAFVGNRLFIGQGNILKEVAADGTLSTIYTHHSTTFRWTCIFSIGSKIYAGGYSGSRSELYSVTVAGGGAAVIGAEAAPFPDNELIAGAISVAGSVLIYSNRGIRLAVVGGDGTLTYGPLIDGPKNIKDAASYGRFVYVTHGSTDLDAGTHRTGVMRLDLTNAAAPLQPAWANDIGYDSPATVWAVYPSYGVAVVDYYTTTADKAHGVFFTVPGAGVYSATADYDDGVNGAYELEGWIDSGLITMGTVEPKIMTQLEVTFLPLAVNESVYAEVLTGEDALIAGTRINTLGADTLLVDIGGRRLHECKVKIHLEGDGATSPTVKSWRIRGYPVPPFVEQWIIPLIIKSRVIVNDGAGQEMSLDTFDEVQRIKNWCETKEPITFREGASGYRVRVDAFEMSPQEWRDRGDFFEATMTVRLVSA